MPAATLGSIAGSVVDVDGRPLAGAAIVATSPSARYSARSDPRGRFTLLGIAPDQYTVTVSATNFRALVAHVPVYPDERATLTARLEPEIRTLSTTIVRASKLGVEQSGNQYAIVGTEAAAQRGVSVSGLSSYVRGSVEGALSNAPGTVIDTFGDALIRGGKADQTIYRYDDVPLAQAEVAEPGGNPIGASLSTTGVAYTKVDVGAFSVEEPSALSGVVDEIAAAGTYPAKYAVSIGTGLVGQALDVDAHTGFADSNLSTRSFVAARVFNDAIDYGDRNTFYPAEAATYGLALHRQGGWSGLVNFHVRLQNRYDVQFLTFGGQAAYDLYGTPFAGQTYQSFGPYPGAASLSAPVRVPTRVRGTYGVQKLQLTKTGDHSLSRLRLYRSDFGSTAFGPFWDDLSFPDGPISLASTTGLTLRGTAVDVETAASNRHELRYGLDVQHQRFAQSETIPVVPEVLTSNPVVLQSAWYATDRLVFSPALKVDLGMRALIGTARRSDGSGERYAVLDPRFTGALQLGSARTSVVKLSAGGYSQPPQALEIERVVRIGTQPPQRLTPLVPERASDYEISFGRSGTLSYKLTGFYRYETNLIDVIPSSFKAPLVVSGTAGASLGVALPENVGLARIRGLELAVEHGGFNMTATYLNGRSSSASQYGLNDLNAPAAAAGHLFPLSYAPKLQAVASYNVRLGKIELGPSVSYESGYPYGNGTKVFAYCTAVSFQCPRADARPTQVLNDNNVDPGFNYYFLRDPAHPYCPLPSGCAGGTPFNPFIGNLGTPEGDDPYSLTSAPALLLSLHAAVHLSDRAQLQLEATNLLDYVKPNELFGNPWLIGPPGYAGSPDCGTAYAKYYGGDNGVGSGCYTLGNGVPTSDGRTRSLPWTYGRDAYVPASYPAPRTIYLRLTWSNL